MIIERGNNGIFAVISRLTCNTALNKHINVGIRTFDIIRNAKPDSRGGSSPHRAGTVKTVLTHNRIIYNIVSPAVVFIWGLPGFGTVFFLAFMLAVIEYFSLLVAHTPIKRLGKSILPGAARESEIIIAFNRVTEVLPVN